MLDLINRYAHGFVAIPVILACREQGLFELLREPMTSLDLAHRMHANEGYLQVALRLLLSLNWLSQNENGEYTLTAKAASHRSLPADLLALYQLDMSAYLMGHVPAGLLREWIDRGAVGWHLSSPLLGDFLDGVLVIPLLLALHQNKRLLPPSVPRDSSRHLLGERVLLEPLPGLVREELSDLFVSKGWAHRQQNHLLLTEVGQFLVERALITGVTASYKPMLAALPELLAGNPSVVFDRDASGHESHLDRTLNVVASGFQHEKYFSDVDEIIVEIFKGPQATQPNYIADMGCGDGSLLARVYEVIREKSARGRVLEQHPVLMIGVDYNQKALEATAQTLSDIPHLVLRGDIGNPEQLVASFAARGIKPEEVLHIRSFLDHDRPFIPPQDAQAHKRAKLAYSGVYVDTSGASIPPYVMVQSLVEHLGRWATVVGRHGLIILEVHCLAPDVVGQFLHQSENLHFDALQAASQQHLVEADVFLLAAAEVGLFPKADTSFLRGLSPVPRDEETSTSFCKRYPRTLPFSRITLTFFEKRPYTIRHPQPSDLDALVNLERECWPEHLRAEATEILGRIERPSGHLVLEYASRVVGVIYSQRITDVDELANATYEKVSSLYAKQGSIFQLISVNVLPEMSVHGLGDQLLTFMLQWLALKGGIRRVVGVTRCKNYAADISASPGSLAPISMAEYIQKRNEYGQLVDPILRFHEAHGATVTGIIHGYRPEDYDNLGKGVLIEYDPKRRQGHITSSSKMVPFGYKSQFEPLNKEKKEERAVSDIVAEAVRELLPAKRRSFFSPTRPLMEIGLDSLDLLELRTLLIGRLGKELEPTFFFRYGSAAAITRYFEGQFTTTESESTEHPLMPPSASGRLGEGEWAKGRNGNDNDRTSFHPYLREASRGREAHSPTRRRGTQEAIAIIGMGCRFPGGVSNPEDYWSLLREGVDAISEVPKTRWDMARYADEIKSGYGGFLEQVEQFDASFFSMAPVEAISTDPQQRILLEVTWEALEGAGLNPQALAGTETGVFVGIFTNDYQLLQVKSREKSPYFGTGTSSSVAAGRLSYFFDFQGPAISVDTACSSSLVALHLACQSLLRNECDLALASGVNLLLSPELSITFSQAGMLAPNGRCKTFDAKADGYVRSEGCGVVVLKLLSDALRDKDNILAVVRGSAINQDGTSNGLTAPNGLAQEAVIQKALSVAGVEPSEVSYVEAHGTGTSLGDPVEVSALQAVYGEGRSEDNALIVGSVKTNIGHTEAAAGVAGLLKVVLSMQRRYIPPHLHFSKLNPHLAPEHSLRIPAEGMAWHGRLIAGVSSFGFSGTNAHVILEQAPEAMGLWSYGAMGRGAMGLWGEGHRFAKESEVERPWHILTLRAKCSQGLRELAQRYADYLASHPSISLADVCFTANTGRAHFEHRLAVVAESNTQLRQALVAFVAGKESMGLVDGQVPASKPPKVAFLFTGQGSQYVGMGRELYETQPTFRKTLIECAEILQRQGIVDRPLLSLLYAKDKARARSSSFLAETAYTQVALFALEYALAKLWQSWGIQPSFVMGHSVGEIVAACVAGVFTLSDGLKLVAERGRLMQSTAPGQMVAVMAGEALVRSVTYDIPVAIAAINGPKNVVISGQTQAIERVVERLERQGVKSKRLRVSHAFHSPLMDPILDDFLKVAQEIQYSEPQIGLISNVTGTLVGASVACAEYWVRHIGSPVRFYDGMRSLREEGGSRSLFIEVGPTPILLGMGRRCLPDSEGTWLPSLRPRSGHGLRRQREWQELLTTLGELYVRGVEVDWTGFDQDYARRKLLLPTYPFQRERYWIDTQASTLKKEPEEAQMTPILQLLQQGKVEQLVEQLEKSCQLEAKEIKTLPKLLDLLYQQHQRELIETTIENWLYQVEWQRKARPLTESYDYSGSWLILADHSGVGARLASYLQAQGQSCLVVYPQDLAVGGLLGDRQVGTRYLNPANPDEFERLLQEAWGHTRKADSSESVTSPKIRVIHLWSLDATPSNQLSHRCLSKEQKLLCGSLLHLVQVLAKFKGDPLISSLVRLWVVTRGAQPTDGTPVAVAQAPVWGLGKVVALEHPELWGGLIDLAPQPAAAEVVTLLGEITAPDGEAQLAFRDGKRLVARLVRANPQERVAPTAMPPLRSDGSYLITGGLGALGLQVARFLVEQGVRHLALMGRRGISSPVAQQTVSQLEEAGVTVLVIKADVSNEQECLEGLNRIKTAMPPLRGVVHAAGVLDDGILLRQTYERLLKVMRAKVEGTWHLHTLTRKNKLDFFVCFSSTASLVGEAGQGNYAAANAFMDALAHYRHSLGLPALSINWGPWAESGMAVGTDFNAKGASPITPLQGLQALKRLLPHGPSVGVINVDWSQYSVGGVSPFLDQLVKVQEVPQEHNLWQQLEKTPQNGRYEILITHIQNKVAQVLALTHQPPVSRGFAEMGMDSLMALELKNRLENSLGRSLPSTLAFDYSTVSTLADYLQEMLALEREAPSTSSKEPQKEGFDMSTVDEANVEQLSVDELMAQITVEFDEAYG